MGNDTTDDFESMLTGGHPNSLGRTDDVAEMVLADKARLDELYQCWFSNDEVVRLRVASTMKRVTIARPDWAMERMDALQSEIAAIDQASTQWTLALVFDLVVDLLSPKQHARAVEIMQHNIENHPDWIVLNNSMKVLGSWAKDDPALAAWLLPQAHRLADDKRNSVAKNARKLVAQLGD